MLANQNFKIALAQINPIVGDFEGNLKKHIEIIKEAKALGARLVVFSELSFVGYIPRDILLEPHFLNHQNTYLHKLQEEIEDIYVIVGAVTKNPSGVEKPFLNSALVFHKKKLLFQYDKRLLPTYDVFDESRYFQRGTSSGLITLEGVNIGLTICEDMWQHGHEVSNTCYNHDPISDLKKAHKLDLIINMSGSPYLQQKVHARTKIISQISKELKCPMIYINQVGANDAIIFDGYSMIAQPSGKVDYLKGFETDLKLIDLYSLKQSHKDPDFSYDLEKALCLGIKDYIHKNGFKKVVIGLSGGIDSALVLALCHEALGAENIQALYLPSKFSSPLSKELAIKIAKNFNVPLDIIAIDPIIESYISSLDKNLKISKGGVALENIQSRIRGNLIMAYANQNKALMMGCSNKSELAVGYGTSYGDIAGALLPIGDLFKVDVFKSAQKLNQGRFPEEVFTRAPSAELYRDQKDSDSLPPYEILDPILKLHLEFDKSFEEICASYPELAPHVASVMKLFKISEFKRYQAPMILKVSNRNFGTGWDMPITRNA